MENLMAVPAVLGLIRDEVLIAAHDAIVAELRSRAVVRGALVRKKRKSKKAKKKTKVVKA